MSGAREWRVDKFRGICRKWQFVRLVDLAEELKFSGVPELLVWLWGPGQWGPDQCGYCFIRDVLGRSALGGSEPYWGMVGYRVVGNVLVCRPVSEVQGTPLVEHLREQWCGDQPGGKAGGPPGSESKCVRFVVRLWWRRLEWPVAGDHEVTTRDPEITGEEESALFTFEEYLEKMDHQRRDIFVTRGSVTDEAGRSLTKEVPCRE
jgi:hypothetical protein